MKLSSGTKCRCTLGELIECFDNKRIPLSAQERATRKGPYRYYGAQNVVDHIDAYLFDGEYALIAEDGENLRSQKQDVAQIVEGQFWVNNHAHIIQANANADLWYLCALLNQTDISRYISGSAQPKLSQEGMRKIVVEVPDVQEQRRIGLLLRCLDRKIALNRRKIATLEKMAKEIYDYWFVQYDFPDANGRPYKSSGGEMVYSPELKREIPKGWRVGCLGDVVDINKRSHNVRTLPEHINYIDISSTQCGFVGTPTVYSRDEVPGRARRIAVDGDIVWSCVRPNLKAFALILSPKDEDVFSTGFAVLSPREIPNSYLYCVTSADSFVSYLVAKTGNSAYPAVLPGDFKLYQLSLPPSDILEAFHDSAGPLFRRRQRCFDEISKLTALRDFLLPLLMNGQVKVGQ